MALAPGGDLYAAGNLDGNGLQAGSQTASLGSATGGLFVARLSRTGAVVWLRVVAGTFTLPRLAADLSTGGVVVADTYRDGASFGTIALPTLASAAGYRPFVARLGATGTWTAARAATGSSDTFGRVAPGGGPSRTGGAGGLAAAGQLDAGWPCGHGAAGCLRGLRGGPTKSPKPVGVAGYQYRRPAKPGVCRGLHRRWGAMGSRHRRCRHHGRCFGAGPARPGQRS